MDPFGSTVREIRSTRTLIAVRERILEEKAKLKDKRTLDSQFHSNFPKDEVATDIKKFVEETRSALPHAVTTHWRQREELENTLRAKVQPYLGDYGLSTYRKWQHPDYYMVRGLVWELVEQILDRYLKPDYRAVHTPAARAAVHAETQKNRRLEQSFSENRVLELIAEEIVLQTTAEVCNYVSQEVYDISRLVKQSTSSLLIGAIQKEPMETPRN